MPRAAARPGSRRGLLAVLVATVVLLPVGGAPAVAAPVGVPAAPASSPAASRAVSPDGVAPQRSAGDRAGLQRRLNGLGCRAGRPDGRADLQLRAALVRFQSRHGLPQSGFEDSATRRVAESSSAQRCDVRPVPARSGEGRRVVVSQGQHWVWLVGPRGRVAAQGPMIDDQTKLRPGTYATGSYCGRPARVARNRDLSGRFHLDSFVRFAPCGFGFHGIPRRVSDGKPVHAEWLLGTDLDSSQGCFRLSRSLRQEVWRFTAGGRTTVRVVP